MDLKFGELVILAESLLSQIDFDSLLSEGDIDVKESSLVKENGIRFDRVALLKNILVEILKHRPLPF